MEKSRQPRAFDPNRARSQSFTGKLIYFVGLVDQAAYYPLQRKLMIVSEEQFADNRNEEDMVLGYVINTPSSIKFREHFQAAASAFDSKLYFMRIMDSYVQGFSNEQSDEIVTFITERDKKSDGFDRDVHLFGDFRAHACETDDDLIKIAPSINKEKNVLLISDQVSLNRKVLERMVEKGLAVVRDATPDIIFYPNPERREAIAFPDHAPKNLL